MSKPQSHDVDVAPAPRATNTVQSQMSLLVDAVLIVLFAVAGNVAHDSGLGIADIWATAWPFLLALALGWLITFSWRYPSNVWPRGVFLVVTVVACGMLFRHFGAEGGIQISFTIVASLVIGTLLLGRRLISRRLLPRADAHPG